MDPATLLAELDTHCDGLRTAAVAAGPNAVVPTCPQWTIERLVRHIGRVHSWVLASIADPTGADVRAEQPPRAWEAALAFWDEQRSALQEQLAGEPHRPAWVPFRGYEPTVASWIRRQAHEAAIHRLDAELARDDAAAQEPAERRASVTFDARFAADGVDELLLYLMPSLPESEHTRNGSVLVEAKDVGRVWSLRIEPGTLPAAADPEQPFEPDLTIESDSADQLYRAVWNRPHRSVVSGDTALLEVMRAP